MQLFTTDPELTALDDNHVYPLDRIIINRAQLIIINLLLFSPGSLLKKPLGHCNNNLQPL